MNKFKATFKKCSFIRSIILTFDDRCSINRSIEFIHCEGRRAVHNLVARIKHTSVVYRYQNTQNNEWVIIVSMLKINIKTTNLKLIKIRKGIRSYRMIKSISSSAPHPTRIYSDSRPESWARAARSARLSGSG